tara:strand:+ start:123 stop:641 length:519 start_codon:yes stop_codon:yes gene_type:complete
MNAKSSASQKTVLAAKLRIAKQKLLLCEQRLMQQLSNSQSGKRLLTSYSNLVGPFKDEHVLGPNWMVENNLRRPEDYVLLLTKNCNGGNHLCKKGDVWFAHKNAVQKLLLQNGNKAVHPISRKPLNTRELRGFLQFLEERKNTRSNTAKPTSRLSAALMSLRPRTRARTSAR